MFGKQLWYSIKGSKTLEVIRTSNKRQHKKSLRVQTLERMTTLKQPHLHNSPSEQELVDIISRAQCQRYESQRSPFPSPIITRTTPINDENMEEEDDVDTPTNNRRILSTDDSQLDMSLNSSGSSDEENSTPARSPIVRLKPNRRSVEALKKLISSSDIKGPFPLVITPPDGGYWIQNGDYETSRDDKGIWHAPEIDTEHFRLENDTTALMYGRHFVGRPHKNFYVKESKFGPLVFSLMIDSDVNCDPLIRMILRTKSENHYKVYPSAQLSRKLEPEEYLGIALSSLDDGEPVRIEGLTKINSKKAPEILQKFDEHSVAKQHKVGVIYQKFGQTTEEEMFSNNYHSPAFKKFLELLGETVTLKDFDGYCGGLDNKNNQTGEKSIYTNHRGQEIMFHVSTLLPYDSGDRQQVARKRHIGNDIVLVVFQDRNTPYSPDCVRSRFLHAHIVVQVEQNSHQEDVYKVAVAAKQDVPEFTPPLPTPAVFAQGHDFREWLLTKILNAEAKCHQAPAFLKLATRTRSQLFIHLLKELSGTKEHIDGVIPISIDNNINNRKSVGADFFNSSSNNTPVAQSPRRRRMTFGSFFPIRQKNSTSTSPKLVTKQPNKRSILTASTPDLSVIGEESNISSSRINHRLSTDNKHMMATKKRFTFRGKKSRNSPPAVLNEERHSNKIHDTNYTHQKSDPQGEEEMVILNSSLNWSVPNNLPGVVIQSTHGLKDPPSLENIRFTLNDSLHHSERWCSNPDIMGEDRHYLSSDTPSYDLLRSPGSAGPQTFDVAVQVNNRRFTFPTPPQSVSPTLPSLDHGVVNRRYQRIRPLIDQQQHEILSGYHSSSSSLDNRSSFPFVPEEEENTIVSIKENEGDDSDNSSSENLTTDSTYDSLLRELRTLTTDVARLREQQIQLYKENTKLSNQVKKWKTKYKCIKIQLQQNSQKSSSGSIYSLDRKSGTK